MEPCNKHSRFDLKYYLNKLQPEKKNPAFQELQNLYQKKIHRYLSDRSWQIPLYNKSVTQLFLDKIGKLYPEKDPFTKISSSFEWNSSTFASMEMIYYLEAVLESPHLKEESKANIRAWLAQERNYLPLAIIYDGWRINNPNVLDAVKKSNSQTGDNLKNAKISAPPKEMDVLVATLLEQIHTMKTGESFKLLGGTFSHEVRIVLTKTQDKFTLNAFDPAQKETLTITDVILNEKFLKDLLQAKFSDSTNAFLEKGGAKWVSDLYSKAAQIRNSCPVQAILKEFKAFFLSCSSSKTEGYSEYKIIKGLMAKQALDNEQSRVEPELFKALKISEMVRGRVLKWSETFKNPVEIQETVDFYQAAFAIVDPDFVMPEPIDITTIGILDQKLNGIIKRELILVEDRIKLNNLCKKTNPLLPISYLLKRNAHSKILNDFLQFFVKYHESPEGKIKEWVKQKTQFFYSSFDKYWETVHTSKDDLIEFLSNERDIDDEIFPKLIEEFFHQELLTERDVRVILDSRITKGFVYETIRPMLESYHASKILNDIQFLLDYSTPIKLHDRKVERFLNNFEYFDDKIFFSMIKKTRQYGYKFSDLSNRIILRIQRNKFEKDIFMPSFVTLYNEGFITNNGDQRIIAELIKRKKIEIDEGFTLLLSFKECAAIEPITILKTLRDGDDAATLQLIQNTLNSKDFLKIDPLFDILGSYQPELVPLFFSEAIKMDLDFQVIRQSLIYLYTMFETKLSTKIKFSVLYNFLNSQKEEFISSLIKENISNIRMMSDESIHLAIKILLEMNHITKEEVKKWRIHIEALTLSYDGNYEPKLYTDALAGLDKILN